MFNLGFTELLLLGLIALIFIGPNQLPEVARTVGRLLNEWKRATNDFQNTITTHITEDINARRTENLPPVEDNYAQHIGSPDGTAHDHGFDEGPVSADEDNTQPVVLPTGIKSDES